MQTLISVVTTITGDLLVLATAVVNLVAAARTRPRDRGHCRHRRPLPDKQSRDQS